MPLWSMMPEAALPPATLFTRHVTVVTFVLRTVAWKVFLSPKCSVAEVASSVTATAGTAAFARVPKEVKDRTTASALR